MGLTRFQNLPQCSCLVIHAESIQPCIVLSHAFHEEAPSTRLTAAHRWQTSLLVEQKLLLLLSSDYATKQVQMAEKSSNDDNGVTNKTSIAISGLLVVGRGCDVAPGTSESVIPLSTVPFCKGRHVADPHTFLASSADANSTPAASIAADAPQILAVVCTYLLSTLTLRNNCTWFLPTTQCQTVSAVSSVMHTSNGCVVEDHSV